MNQGIPDKQAIFRSCLPVLLLTVQPLGLFFGYDSQQFVFVVLCSGKERTMAGSLSPTTGASDIDRSRKLSPSHVIIETIPDDIPSVPDWFAEVTVVLQILQHRRVLQTISDQVRLPRGKAGTFTVLDYVLVLVAYALSGEPTIAAFYARLNPFQDVFAALLNREKVPHASSLSRFLADVTPACVASMRQVMEHDLFTAGLRGEAIGGLWDHQGTRHLVFDVDATRGTDRGLSGVFPADPVRATDHAVTAHDHGNVSAGRPRNNIAREWQRDHRLVV
jgi:hypothetical protein